VDLFFCHPLGHLRVIGELVSEFFFSGGDISLARVNPLLVHILHDTN